jgi:hypothetical protein
MGSTCLMYTFHSLVYIKFTFNVHQGMERNHVESGGGCEREEGRSL